MNPLTPKSHAEVNLKVHSAQVAQSKAYTSVQFEDENEVEKAHFELGSELVYINHGCEPNVAFELPGGWNGLEEGHWCLRSLSEIKEGDVLTFAYFSTEWDMAQPFQCECGSKSCLGKIRGAKYLPKEMLNKYVDFLQLDYSRSMN
ncbi:uncharacterized protein PGTG_02897 [Puccinia graminis f. sp. tritici CRL 75-36-700-3]|uniref:Post-SET domain-containing protein n=1 Tax=Puccinia graminis f. sp. tritici (strain CRL 75-36-700-3 / race SCCL) TaxID=418459 RepID=E3JWN1_PUCGT|nr:uncharacterized protein PGTG_02897 [Puccinia graminis f. sp. tritici CRL 75-36-700-3]EFP76456.2 hypothetical protein PGTG_02897 [Puccinia graminis f. sp. tritici CRL 75-36-700-3]